MAAKATRSRQKKGQATGRHISTYSGMRVVNEALRSNRVRVCKVYATAEVAKRSGLKHSPEIEIVERRRLDQITGDRDHQGIACVIDSLPTVSLEELTSAENKANLLALDRVQDPMNLGALLRCANAFGVGTVLAPKNHTAPLRAAAVQASAGAAFHTPLLYVTNLERSLEQLKSAGYWVVALLPPTSEEQQHHTHAPPLLSYDADPPTPWVLVAGGEGAGIRPLVVRAADYHFTISMQGEIDSLNVSTACAIALFRLTSSLASAAT